MEISPTASPSNLSGGGPEDRVMATAAQIVKSLNTSNIVKDDMLLIFKSFDNRFSNLTLNQDELDSYQSRLEELEKVILRRDPSSDASVSSFEDSPLEAAQFLSAVDKILELLDDFSVRSDHEIIDRAETAIQIAMARLEDEFRQVLIGNTLPLDADRLYGSIRRVSLSFAANEVETADEEELESFGEDNESACFHERGASLGDDLFVDLINPDAVVELKDIADRMVRAGYEKECVQVYSSVRRDALDECLVILGVERLSIEEVQKMDWICLDEKMKKWIQAVKIAVKVLLSGERRLCDQIFSLSNSAKEVCFNETAKWCLMPLLNFAEAVAIVKRSSEKLFRILDMYDALEGVLRDLELLVGDEFVRGEAKGVLDWLGEAARGTFKEFENNVQSETSKKPMVGGEIHPLTRYVMNYVKLVVDYSETLNSLWEGQEEEQLDGLQNDESEQMENVTPIARRLFALLSVLESNLDAKSRLYDDLAMQYIFLMNNILYIVQKVKDSELINILGDQWVRKRRGQIKQCATAYLRATWSKALSCLKDDRIVGSPSNVPKMALKESFKNFNACFEEVYRVQTGWKVPDPQLREELRISISEKVMPAYSSFMGRFGSHLESGGRHAGKYVKYTPEDLENYLPDLFEGVPLVIHHPKRKIP